MPHPVTTMVRRGWLPDLALFARLLPSYYRIAFRGAGLRSGILGRLGHGPATADELATDLGLDPSMLDGLRSWLDLGVDLRELRRDGDRYAIRSRGLRRLLRPAHDPLAAMYEEMVVLDHRLVVETPDRLREGRPFTLADADAEVIARDSRIGEPWLEVAVADAVPATGNGRLLEVGCGSGAHIRTAAALNPGLGGVGLELQEPAAALARRNLAAWGLASRFEVVVGDVREFRDDEGFDLVTLHQNIYYFPAGTLPALFTHLGSLLRPGGRLLVTSMVRGAGLSTSGLDLWGAMTEGAERLPVPDELVAVMRAAGFTDATSRPLGVDGMYHAFTGTWRGAGAGGTGV